MQFLKKVLTAPLYLRYFLHVVDRHSLQSPFIFDFYGSLKQAVSQSNGYEDIESVRSLLVNDKSIVGGIDLGAGSQTAKSLDCNTVSNIARYGISSKKDCIFLYELLKKSSPKTCIELGTSLGIATAYLSRAAGEGDVISFEGNKSLVSRAEGILKELRCENVQIIQGNIDVKLPEYLSKVPQIDFAIIDANHTERALISYFNMMQDKMTDSGIIVIDDIRWSNEMYRAWEKLYSDSRVAVSIEFLGKGLLIFNSSMRKQHYVLSY